MSDRPDRPGSTKRRPGDQLNKDNYEDEVEGEGPDPGEWRPADEGAIKARRKIHVRRGGQAAETAPAAEAGSNPFASIALAPPAQAGGNPFAGINLVPTTQANGASAAAGKATADTAAKTEDAKTDTESAAAADGKENSTVPAAANTDAPTSTGGFAALAAGNPFGSLSGKPFGGFGGGFAGTAGGFGALAASGGTFGASTGTTGTAVPTLGSGFGSGFNFGNSAFPAVTSTPLGSSAPAFKAGSTGGGAAGGASAAAGEGEEEEAGEAAGEGGEDVALFGNATVQPVVSLPEQAKRTGEEEEAVLFSADGSLFEFDTAANRWRERGKGEFKVNASQSRDDTVKQTRMVMRQAANLRLLLNAKVYPGMPLQLMPSNVGVTFGVVNAAGSSTSGNEAASKEFGSAAAEGAGAESTSGAGAVAKPTTWAVKIKSSEKVLALHELLNSLKTPAAQGAAEPTSQGAV